MYEVRLHVGGLTNAEVGAPDVARFLLSLGVFKVRGVDLVADPHTGEPRGFAYCDVACTDEVQLHRAIRKYTGTKWRSCKLRFGVAKPDFRQRLQREWDEEAATRLEAKEAARLEEEARRIELKIAADALGDTNSLTLSTSGAHCRKRTRVVVPFGAPQTVVARGDDGASRAVSARPAEATGKKKNGKKVERPVRTIFDDAVQIADLESDAPHAGIVAKVDDETTVRGSRSDDSVSADGSEDSESESSSNDSGSTDDESEKKEEIPRFSDAGQRKTEDRASSEDPVSSDDSDGDGDGEEASASDEDAALRSVLFGDVDDEEEMEESTAAHANGSASQRDVKQHNAGVQEFEDSSDAESDSSGSEEPGNASPQKRRPGCETESPEAAKKSKAGCPLCSRGPGSLQA
eukprot:INCI16690.1.p1 GENE.INCI16690.1~~INCI16690.1.p1  ORF type:complete len:405 (-),score=95.19 INCI16690.1:405-1619(-)